MSSRYIEMEKKKKKKKMAGRVARVVDELVEVLSQSEIRRRLYLK